MTDGKEWVSIKIPESVRDPARDDPRTYGQIMQAGLENEPFAGGDDPDRIMENIEGAIDRAVGNREIDHTNGADAEAIAREVSKQLDYVELSNRVAEELEGRML